MLFYISLFLLVFRFDGKILCSVKKCLHFKKNETQNTTVYPLRKLLWMGFKNNDISQEKTFKHYNYAKTAQLYPYTGAKRQRSKFQRICIKFRWKNFVKPCKLSYCNVSLVDNLGRFIGKNLRYVAFFNKVAPSN